MTPARLQVEGGLGGGNGNLESTPAAPEDQSEEHHAARLTESWYRSDGLWRNGYQDAIALNMAVQQGDLALLYHLLSNGADPDLVDESGKTPLFTAVQEIRRLHLLPNRAAEASNTQQSRAVIREMVDLLLLYNANTNIPCDDLFPIDQAVHIANDDLVLCLLQHGSVTTTLHHDPPLSRAILNHHYLIITHLLDHGANPNVKTRRGDKMLHIAASISPPEVVQKLLDNGARPNALGYRGKTPLYRAAENSVWGAQVANVLLTNGASLELRGKQVGLTPIGRAATVKNWPLVWTLLGFDPEPQTRRCFKDAPYPALASLGNPATELLRKKGINVKSWLPNGVPESVVVDPRPS